MRTLPLLRPVQRAALLVADASADEAVAVTAPDLASATAKPATPDLASAALDAIDSSLPDGTTLTDTLADVGVYVLLAGAIALTIFSVVATLQKSNDEYGGWTPREDEASPINDDLDRLKPGSVYDPTTDTWTYKKPEPAPTRVGRAPPAVDESGQPEKGNRYERRMNKKKKSSMRK